MRKFTNYEVTALARSLSVQIYHLVRMFPAEEKYALSQQLRRAVVSIGANIAEGAGRHTDKDFAHFPVQSIGSACEVEYLLLLSTDLGYLSKETAQEKDREIQVLKSKLYRLRKAILGES